MKKIYIIGAGIAGLAAANYLKKNGHEVILLEARNYIGGRIKTDHSLNIPFPCGAAFVHGNKNDLIYKLIQHYQPELYDFQNASVSIFDDQPSLHLLSNLENSRNQFEQFLNKSKQQSHNLKKDISLLDSINQLIKKQQIATDKTISWDLKYLSLFTGVEAEFLSAKHWDQMGELGGDHLLLSSYEILIKSLAENQVVLKNTIVTDVNYNQNHVLIKTCNDTFKADAVVVTVPLGVLQSNKIQFHPSLPIKKQSSIQSLKMGQLNKIGLLFPKQFWPKDAVIGYNSCDPDDIPLFFNYSYFLNKPVLLGAISGKHAIWIETDGPTAFKSQTMKTLRKLFGNNIPEPLKFITTSWITDPYSLGSYSYIPIGASGEDFDVLAETIANKVFFAGEATYRSCHSTVQGAYLSGIREAKKISAMLSRNKISDL